MRYLVILSLIISLTSFSIILSKQLNPEPSPLKVGETAPAFEGKDQQRKTFRLKEATKKGAVVLFFYRGQWCPYCNKYMMSIQDSLQLIYKKGATVIGVSLELPENITKTIEKTKASFPLIYDKDSKISKLYNVAYKPDTAMLKALNGYGINLKTLNGNDDELLPVPATYVIGKDGKIKFVHFDKNFKNRAKLADVLQAL